jgi:transposase
MPQKYIVQLGEGDRHQLRSLLSKGRASARCLTRVRVLLKAHAGLTDQQIADAVEVSLSLVYDVRRGFVQAGLTAALDRRPQPPRPDQRRLDGDAEAHLITLACSHPPEGRDGWTLQLLADRLVQLHHIESVSRETVRRTLKKTN